jgi:CheY-like chemotaxis protein
VTVFISHSFDDRSAFDNVAYALRTSGVSHWPPAAVQAGESLRTQLFDAIGGCGVCVFIATRRSVASRWCHTELGAFWGVGRKIVVFLADSTLGKEELPPIVADDVWEDRLERLAARVKELDDDAIAGGDVVAGSARVGNLTVEQLLPQLAEGVVALLTAQAKDGVPAARTTEQTAREAADHLLRGIDVTNRVRLNDEGWRRHVLWVDDRPGNNVYERQAMEAAGLEFTLALSTDEALGLLGGRRFAAIISDMGRREGPREGYVLLEALRRTDPTTPFFIYAGSRAADHRAEAAARGAQGTTNRPDELVDMVVQAVRATVPRR